MCERPCGLEFSRTLCYDKAVSNVKLSEFDRFGTFRLRKDEVVGIEDLVQRLDQKQYLSRNRDYYAVNRWKQGYVCLADIYAEYQRLNQMLPLDGKPAFVICEKMHELATRVVNTIQQTHKTHLFQDGTHFDTVAQKCAQECADNLVRLMHGQTAEKVTTDLRDETRLRPNMQFDTEIMEAENKKQLYLCANALPDATHLITPGRGSAKLGTMVQAIRRHKGLKSLPITQIYYSHYANKTDATFDNLPEKLLIMDDTIFHGSTLVNLKKYLTAQGHQVTNGAVNASFYNEQYGMGSIFQAPEWADYIDIIPNQYGEPFDQMTLNRCLRDCQEYGLGDLLSHLDDPRNNCVEHTADYKSMREAEEAATALGADLYKVSAKISATAVAYNKKIRAQVEADNAELQNTF